MRKSEIKDHATALSIFVFTFMIMFLMGIIQISGLIVIIYMMTIKYFWKIIY